MKERRTCSIPDCPEPVKGAGYCNSHYLRFRRHGDPLAGGPFQPRKPAKLCSLPGCGERLYAKGYCSSHYQLWRANGDPTINLAPKGVPAGERFWPQVNRRSGEECWPWRGWLDKEGYGRFQWDSGQRAHRFAYVVTIGPIPEGLTLDHQCHNEDPTCPGGPTCQHRRCCNPAHLEPATSGDNMLRGNAIQAINARKTHCSRGHPFDEINTYWYIGANGNRYRACRTCIELRRQGAI